MTDVIETATRLVEHHHFGQVRPNKAQTPKLQHIFEVADLVRRHGGTPNEIASALLHDAVEDTDLTLAEIRARTNEEVALLVDWLTDPPAFEAMPLIECKFLQALRIRTKSAGVKVVKIADQTSNLWSVATDPPLDWVSADCMNYADGALLIVNECRGTCADLEALFDEAYGLCTTLYSAPEITAKNARMPAP